jgi:hypothetical protein
MRSHGKRVPSFVPDAEAGTLGARSTDTTDDNGHYRIVCEVPRKAGAVVGKHAVVVFHLNAAFDEKYKTAARTPLHIEVAPGARQVMDFNVEPPSPEKARSSTRQLSEQERVLFDEHKELVGQTSE